VSSASSAPDNQKYHARMTSRYPPLAHYFMSKEGCYGPSKLHCRPDPSECAGIEVTKIREGCEFKDLDHREEEEGLRS
jgi:hypothetical protein